MANRGVITYYKGALGNHESTRVGAPTSGGDTDIDPVVH
jgi:hypothetical protein